MDSATLIIALAALEEGAVRPAARLLERAPSSVAAALDRLEQQLAVPLLHRAGGGLALSVSAEALLPRLRQLCEGLAPLAGLGAAGPGAGNLATQRWLAANPVRLRALRRFARVVRTGSIRRAARDIGIGQPQLTRQMRDLEQALGCVLMERGAAGIEPTPEGRQLYDIAVESERLWGELTATSARRFVRELKTVRLGSIIPLAHEGRLARLLATLVAHWAPRDEHRLFLSSSTADDLLAGLKAGRFDAVLVDVDMLPDSFEHKDIMTSELALVGAPDSRFDAGDGPPPIDRWLKERRFALPSDRTGLRHRIRALMEAGGLDARRLDDALEIDSVAVILRLVIEHGFASVLPLDAVRALSTPLLLRPLGAGSHISYRLVWLPTHASRLAASAIEAAFLRLSAPAAV